MKQIKMLFKKCCFLLAVASVLQLTGCSKYDPKENFVIKVSEKNTTITRYTGTTKIVNIPPKIDGHYVVQRKI